MKKHRNKGSLKKLGERKYRFRLFLGYKENNKRNYLTETWHCGLKEAQSHQNRLITEIENGTYRKEKAVFLTLNKYLDQWLAMKKENVAYRTFEGYEGLFRRYVRESFGKLQLSELSPSIIQDFYMSLHQRGLSACVVRQVHTALKASLEQAVSLELMTRNPAAKLNLPKLKRVERRILSESEARNFLNVLNGERFEVMFTFALWTGARPEEIFGLQWKYLDFVKETVQIQRVVVRHRAKGGWHFAEPKTAKSRRLIQLPKQLIEKLVIHKERQNAEKLKAGKNWQDNDLVFASTFGTPLQSKIVFEAFKKILVKADLPKSIRLYDLRHSCATLFLGLNVSPKIVSERLGHSSLTITLDTYSHVLPTMQKEANEKLENALFS